jgi:hypothetical protein
MRGEERGGGKKTKSTQSIVSFLLVSVISAVVVGYKCAWLVGWLGCGEPLHGARLHSVV